MFGGGKKLNTWINENKWGFNEFGEVIGNFKVNVVENKKKD